MTIQHHHFDLLADYFQFYLQDESAKGDLSDIWTPNAVDLMLALATGAIGVGTVRNMRVSVDVDVASGAPENTPEVWDQVLECSMDVPSGRIVVAGCTDYFPDAARIVVQPGIYRVRVFYAGLDSLSEDGLNGNDRYAVMLWLGSHTEVLVIKAKQPGRSK